MTLPTRNALDRPAAAIVRAWHASPVADIERFYALSHFGSEAAARVRGTAAAKIGATMTLYEVELTFAGVVTIADLDPDGPRSAVHSALRLADELFYAEMLLFPVERDAVVRASGDSATAARVLVAVLAAHGIDGLAYRNDFESPGSISWIITRPEQVRIVRTSNTNR